MNEKKKNTEGNSQAGSEENVLETLNDNLLLEIANEYFPEDRKIDLNKGLQIANEAKKIFKGIKTAGELKKNFEMAQEFLKIGNTDIQRSKILYTHRDFAGSTYHLQQAAEKIIKAHGLSQEVFSDKDLRQISHNTPRAFIKFLEEKRMQLIINGIKNLTPELKTDLEPLKITIETKDKEFALMNKEQIDFFLDIANKIENALVNTDIDDLLKSVLINIAEDSGKPINYPSFSVMKFTSSFVRLYLIAAFTYPHEAYTRYPDRDIKPSQYTEELGIVKATPRILKDLESSSVLLEQFIAWKNENRKEQN